MIRLAPLFFAIALVTAKGSVGIAAPATGTTEAEVLAPGWRPLDFPAPEPGSYELPSLGEAADGALLDERGAPVRLHALLGEEIAILAFVYLSCPDINGCPLAARVMERVRDRLLADPETAAQVRLLSVSFDPVHDPPEKMRRYGEGLAREGVEWRFLTAASEGELAPLLEAYGQVIQREVDETGKQTGAIAHLLRVFLIDRRKRIRNIYSSSFLHADTVWSDVRTVLADEPPGEVPETDLPATVGPDGAPPAGGLAETPLGLPPLVLPPESALSAERVSLGRKLFFDRRLSRNGTMSCAMCHVPEQGFTLREMATPVGIEGRTVRRNPPTLYNVAYLDRLFHDARESRLEQQIWGPLLAGNEMGNPSVGSVLDRIRASADYAGLFEAAFAGSGPTMETLGLALASFQRTLLAGDSPFDRWHFGGDPAALSESAQRGFRLFTGKAGCAACHPIGREHALFTDGGLHDTGIGYRQSMARRPDRVAVRLRDGSRVELETSSIAGASEAPPTDLGRYEITGDPDDRWRYRTPTLRNVALTAPYMHDGSLRTLGEVVDFYDAGGVPHELLDERIRPLGLSPAEKQDLLRFLESLTGEVATIVAEARSTPVGNPGS